MLRSRRRGTRLVTASITGASPGDGSSRGRVSWVTPRAEWHRRQALPYNVRVTPGRRTAPRKWILRIVAALAILVALAAFVWLWWLGVPALYADVADVRPPDRLAAVTTTRTALLAGLVGIGAVGAFWRNARAHRFMAESLRLAEENLRQTTRGQEETLRLTERGHLTDRYGKAIEQLGSHKLDVRLGGIYALEQFANDTDHDRDQATIVEVLSAFVRVHSQPIYQYREHLSLLGSAPRSRKVATDSTSALRRWMGLKSNVIK